MTQTEDKCQLLFRFLSKIDGQCAHLRDMSFVDVDMKESGAAAS